MTSPGGGDSPWQEWVRAEIARTDGVMRQSGALMLALGLVSGAAAGLVIAAVYGLPPWAAAVLVLLCGSVGGGSAVRMLRSEQLYGERIRSLAELDPAVTGRADLQDPRARAALRDTAVRMHRTQGSARRWCRWCRL